MLSVPAEDEPQVVSEEEEENQGLLKGRRTICQNKSAPIVDNCHGKYHTVRDGQVSASIRNCLRRCCAKTKEDEGFTPEEEWTCRSCKGDDHLYPERLRRKCVPVRDTRDVTRGYCSQCGRPTLLTAMTEECGNEIAAFGGSRTIPCRGRMCVGCVRTASPDQPFTGCKYCTIAKTTRVMKAREKTPFTLHLVFVAPHAAQGSEDLEGALFQKLVEDTIPKGIRLDAVDSEKFCVLRSMPVLLLNNIAQLQDADINVYYRLPFCHRSVDGAFICDVHHFDQTQNGNVLVCAQITEDVTHGFRFKDLLTLRRAFAAAPKIAALEPQPILQILLVAIRHRVKHESTILKWHAADTITYFGHHVTHEWKYEKIEEAYVQFVQVWFHDNE